MNLEKDFSDFVELLNIYKVDYMVVGGYALAFHGEPRTTGDMDIWIDCTFVTNPIYRNSRFYKEQESYGTP